MANIPDWVKEELDLRHQRLLDDIRHIVSGSESIKELGQRLTATVRYAMGVDVCVARLLDGGRLWLLGEAGLPPGTAEEWMNANEGIAAQIMQGRRPLTIGNAEDHSATAKLHSLSKEKPNKFQFHSYAGAPMIYHNEITGVLGLFTVERSRYFSAHDLEQLQTVSNIVAEAVQDFKKGEGGMRGEKKES